MNPVTLLVSNPPRRGRKAAKRKARGTRRKLSPAARAAAIRNLKKARRPARRRRRSSPTNGGPNMAKSHKRRRRSSKRRSYKLRTNPPRRGGGGGARGLLGKLAPANPLMLMAGIGAGILGVTYAPGLLDSIVPASIRQSSYYAPAVKLGLGGLGYMSLRKVNHSLATGVFAAGATMALIDIVAQLRASGALGGGGAGPTFIAPSQLMAVKAAQQAQLNGWGESSRMGYGMSGMGALPAGSRQQFSMRRAA